MITILFDALLIQLLILRSIITIKCLLFSLFDPACCCQVRLETSCAGGAVSFLYHQLAQEEVFPGYDLEGRHKVWNFCGQAGIKSGIQSTSAILPKQNNRLIIHNIYNKCNTYIHIIHIIHIITILRIVACFHRRQKCTVEGLDPVPVLAEAENRSNTRAYQIVSSDTTNASLSIPYGQIMTGSIQ